MHNCAHDIHASILLGTAAILIANKNRISGKIVFLFQADRGLPGGADDIVHEKILERLGVRTIFAEHVAPGLPIGTIAIAPGFALAGSNYFHLKIKGTGSHAAAPNEGSDTPLVAARMAIELSEYPARHLDIANRPVTISVTPRRWQRRQCYPRGGRCQRHHPQLRKYRTGENGEHSLKEKARSACLANGSGGDCNYDKRGRLGSRMLQLLGLHGRPRKAFSPAKRKARTAPTTRGIEARMAETRSDSIHESPVRRQPHAL
ncbi:hypothetical protein ACVWWO_003427 [Bradyrhizobium sp. F1.13.1]